MVHFKWNTVFTTGYFVKADQPTEVYNFLCVGVKQASKRQIEKSLRHFAVVAKFLDLHKPW